MADDPFETDMTMEPSGDVDVVGIGQHRATEESAARVM